MSAIFFSTFCAPQAHKSAQLETSTSRFNRSPPDQRRSYARAASRWLAFGIILCFSAVNLSDANANASSGRSVAGWLKRHWKGAVAGLAALATVTTAYEATRPQLQRILLEGPEIGVIIEANAGKTPAKVEGRLAASYTTLWKRLLSGLPKPARAPSEDVTGDELAGQTRVRWALQALEAASPEFALGERMGQASLMLELKESVPKAGWGILPQVQIKVVDGQTAMSSRQSRSRALNSRTTNPASLDSHRAAATSKLNG